MITPAQIQSVGNILNDASRPLKERFRALFTLKNIGGTEAIDCIAKAFDDKSALLKHEAAYCLGQMGDTHAVPVLRSVLEDQSREAIVRHEAAEALAAIADPGIELHHL
jgi:deoxyhypusine monooxygenase